MKREEEEDVNGEVVVPDYEQSYLSLFFSSGLIKLC